MVGNPKDIGDGHDYMHFSTTPLRAVAARHFLVLRSQIATLKRSLLPRITET
jgi:hypothetical protein